MLQQKSAAVKGKEKPHPVKRPHPVYACGITAYRSSPTLSLSKERVRIIQTRETALSKSSVPSSPSP